MIKFRKKRVKKNLKGPLKNKHTQFRSYAYTTCFILFKIMSSKMKVASQHWTDWTDRTDCIKQNKSHFYTVKIEKIFIHDSRV